MWKSVEKMLNASDVHKEMVESVVEDRMDQYALDARDIAVQVGGYRSTKSCGRWTWQHLLRNKLLELDFSLVHSTIKISLEATNL